MIKIEFFFILFFKIIWKKFSTKINWYLFSMNWTRFAKRSLIKDVLNIYISSFFNMIGMSIVSPILPIYSISFGVSYAVASLAISAYAFGRLMADIPVGVAADRWGRRNLMLIGSILITLMAFANGFFTDTISDVEVL